MTRLWQVSISMACGGPVLFVQKFVDDRLQLVLVFTEEVGIELTVCKSHCHEPFHWGLGGRWSLPLSRDPVGNIWVMHPLGRVLDLGGSWEGGEGGEQGVKSSLTLFLGFSLWGKS